ncbi:MAG: gamma-glutamyltransferase, partial [Planctomycetota bacterium]
MGPVRVRAERLRSRTVSRAQQQKGYLSAVIPSLPATLGAARERFGRLSLGRVMEPAIRLAEEGYPISRLQRRQLGWCLEDLRASPAARKLFLGNGRRYRVGEVFRQPELAATLRRLAACGVGDFYTGGIARAILKDVRGHGGLFSAEDLRDLRLPVQRDAVSIDYRGCRVLTAPPPG